MWRLFEKLIEKLLKNYGAVFGALLTDLSKGFDYIPHDLSIQKEPQKLIKIFLKSLILKTLVFLVMKIKKNIQSMYQKNVVKNNMLIYY